MRDIIGNSLNSAEFLDLYQKEKVIEYDNQVQDSPLLSVCVVTFQHVKYIRQCLDSILNQKVNFDYEVLIGDDSSSDGTRDVCIEYAEKYQNQIRLFLHSQQNNIKIGGNPTGRFNILYNLIAARGKYIAICEGDDFWTDLNKLQKQVDILEEDHSRSASFHKTKQFTEIETTKSLRVFGVHEKKEIGAIDTIDKLAPFHTSSFVFRNQFKEFFCEELIKLSSFDMALFSIVASKGKLYGIPEVMSAYRKHSGGITNSSGHLKEYHKNRIDLMNFLNEYHEYKYDSKVQEVINFHQSRINKHEQNGFLGFCIKFKRKLKRAFNS